MVSTRFIRPFAYCPANEPDALQTFRMPEGDEGGGHLQDNKEEEENIHCTLDPKLFHLPTQIYGRFRSRLDS